MDKNLLETLDEQVIVGFTGRVNVLDLYSKQLYGYLTINEGQIFECTFKGVKGLKSFYNIILEESDNHKFDYIVEPEVIDLGKRTIFYPFGYLKNKVAEVLQKYQESKTLRPPKNIKLVLEPSFISEGDDLTGEEYDLMCTISDYSKVDDIYKHCALLDYEITNALVSLRKKKAIKVIKNIGN